MPKHKLIDQWTVTFGNKVKCMEIKVSPEAKALIFDLDGTLSDSLPVHVETWNKIGEKYGFVFNPKIVHEMTGRPTIEFARESLARLEGEVEEDIKMNNYVLI